MSETLNTSSWLQSVILDVAIAFAHADGRLEIDEIEHIQRIAQQMGLSIQEGYIQSKIKENPEDVIINSAKKAITPQSRRILYREACLICLADGELAPAEKMLLCFLQQSLGLSTLFSDAMIEWSQATLDLRKAGVILIQFGDDALNMEAL